MWEGEQPLSAQGGSGTSSCLPHSGLLECLYRLVANLEGGSAGAEFVVREAPEPAISVEGALAAPVAGLPARAGVHSALGRPLAEAQCGWWAVRISRAASHDLLESDVCKRNAPELSGDSRPPDLPPSC